MIPRILWQKYVLQVQLLKATLGAAVMALVITGLVIMALVEVGALIPKTGGLLQLERNYVPGLLRMSLFPNEQSFFPHRHW